MKHFGKLTTGVAAVAVGVALWLMPSGAGASSTSSSSSTSSTTTPTTTPSGSTNKTTTTATPTVGRWTVQVASFKTKAEAKTKLAQLRKLGFKHFHIAHVGADYLVRERHLHHSTATKLVAKLKADGITAKAMR